MEGSDEPRPLRRDHPPAPPGSRPVSGRARARRRRPPPSDQPLRERRAAAGARRRPPPRPGARRHARRARRRPERPRQARRHLVDGLADLQRRRRGHRHPARRATQHGSTVQIEALERSSENERGGYLWRGELRLWDGQVLMGYYAAADGNVLSKGTMYFVLHAQGEYAHGRWVGLSYDGPVVSGYAALARTQDDAQAVMQRLIEAGGAGMTDDDSAKSSSPRLTRLAHGSLPPARRGPPRLVGARGPPRHQHLSMGRRSARGDRGARVSPIARRTARRHRRFRRRAPPVRSAEHHSGADRRRQSRLPDWIRAETADRESRH